MYDATAKLPSGLLNGNVNQYGDFDQCIEAFDGYESDQIGIDSQYCLASIQITVDTNHNYLNYLRSLMLSFEAYKSKFEDVSNYKL